MVTPDDLQARRLFDAPGDLTGVQLHPSPPEEAGAALRRLGPPPGPAGAATGRLQDAVVGAARRAWRLLVDPAGGGDR